jgi:hypothetical protein
LPLVNTPSGDPGGPTNVEIGIGCDGRYGVRDGADWKPSIRFVTDHVYHPCQAL